MIKGLKQDTRPIKRVIIHCAATKPSMDIGVWEIRQWHKDKGWNDIGYHFVIKRDGVVQTGRPLRDAGAHAQGHNFDSVGICLVGGITEEGKSDSNFTAAQWSALEDLVKTIAFLYPIDDVLGHRDLPDVAKDCPCFDVRSWYSTVTEEHHLEY